MNIVLATDDRYVPYCVTTIMSIVRNNNKCVFYILNESLTSSSKDSIDRVAKTNGSKVVYVEVPSYFIEELPMPSDMFLSHLSLATYYRLFISTLLPSDIDKVLYLDCDILIRKSLEELYNTDLDGYALGAVYQIDREANWRCEVLGIPLVYGYFNAGVLLVNLKYWRENDVKSLFQAFIENNYDRILYHDQDVLNAVLYKHTKRLPCKWNMTSHFFRRSARYINEVDSQGNIIRKNEDYKQQIPQEIKDPTVIHFVAKPKPWDHNCNHIWKSEYKYYYEMCGYNLSVSVKDNIRFLVVRLVRFLRIDLLKDLLSIRKYGE